MTFDADATRRDVLRVLGGGSLALFALAGMNGNVLAQGATPPIGESLGGAYAVVRVRKVKPEFSATALAQEVGEGFVPIVREVPGFIHYFVVANEEQRSWVSVGIFTDKTGADESTERAIAFGQQGTHDWVEGDPIIIAGTIEASVPSSCQARGHQACDPLYVMSRPSPFQLHLSEENDHAGDQTAITRYGARGIRVASCARIDSSGSAGDARSRCERNPRSGRH